MTRLCADCGVNIDHRHYLGVRCFPCCKKRESNRMKDRIKDWTDDRKKAGSAVAYAVTSGRLKPIKECICVDCGKTAEHYDHRDYAKPLDVVPVCQSCNIKRGGGENAWIEGKETKRKKRDAVINRMLKDFELLNGVEKTEIIEQLMLRKPEQFPLQA